MNIEEIAKTLHGVRSEIIGEAARLQSEADEIRMSKPEATSAHTSMDTLLRIGRRGVMLRGILKRHDVAISIANQINEAIVSLASLEEK